MYFEKGISTGTHHSEGEQCGRGRDAPQNAHISQSMNQRNLARDFKDDAAAPVPIIAEKKDSQRRSHVYLDSQLLSHQNVVDWDVNELDEEAHKSHNHHSHASRQGNFLELCWKRNV